MLADFEPPIWPLKARAASLSRMGSEKPEQRAHADRDSARIVFPKARDEIDVDLPLAAGKSDDRPETLDNIESAACASCCCREHV